MDLQEHQGPLVFAATAALVAVVAAYLVLADRIASISWTYIPGRYLVGDWLARRRGVQVYHGRHRQEDAYVAVA